MTYNDAKKYLIVPAVTSTEPGKEKQKEVEAYTMALIAFEKLDMIQRIIDVPNSIMQEDVVKYQMIEQVMRNG